MSHDPRPASPAADPEETAEPALPLLADPAGSAPRAPDFPRSLPTRPEAARTSRRSLRLHRRAARSAALGARVALIALIAYAAMFNFSVVRGSSMAPGIHDGDRILVDRLAYLLGDVQRGDIVVHQFPLDPSLDYIKRVIGLPGDEVLMRDGRVWVNGRLLTEPYVTETDRRDRFFARVEPGHVFVLGDNRPHSSDSREFGQVPAELVRGKVHVRVWPPVRLGALH